MRPPELNLETLRGLRKVLGEPEFRAVVADFIALSHELPQTLESSFHAGDWRSVHRTAYRIKSLAFLVGAEPLGEASRALELSTVFGTTQPPVALLHALREELRHARDGLARATSQAHYQSPLPQ